MYNSATALPKREFRVTMDSKPMLSGFFSQVVQTLSLPWDYREVLAKLAIEESFTFNHSDSSITVTRIG